MAPSRLFFSLPPYFVFQFPRWLVIVADVKCDEPEAELIEMDTMKIQHRRNFYSFFLCPTWISIQCTKLLKIRSHLARNYVYSPFTTKKKPKKTKNNIYGKTSFRNHSVRTSAKNFWILNITNHSCMFRLCRYYQTRATV